MFGAAKTGGAAEPPGRRQTRQRKVSQRMAVVDEGTRAAVTRARLDALEADHDARADDAFGLLDSDDDEYVASDDDGGGGGGEGGGGGGSRKVKKKGSGGVLGGKRKTRGQLAGNRGGGPKSFQRLLEESDLDAAPPPNYLTAAAAPSNVAAARKFCTVCGFTSPYTCPRCGSRYCCRKCFVVHTETRCLKFMA